jgi:hypothetical protein
LPFDDIRDDKVAARRTLKFSVVTQPKLEFVINGKVFDPNRVDVRARVGTVEEWTLVNDSKEDHPFHIHTNEFIVTKIGGKRVTPHVYEDVVRIPRGGTITMRTKIRTFTGKAVYHCHILFHEDHGMMGVIEFVKKKTAAFRIRKQPFVPKVKPIEGLEGGEVSEGTHASHAGAAPLPPSEPASSTAFASFGPGTPSGTLLCHLPGQPALPSRRGTPFATTLY